MAWQGILRCAQNDVGPAVTLSEAKGLAVKTYSVYIMTNRSGTLYTGVTNNLMRRVLEHKRKLVPGFTTRYNINRLVYFENFSQIRDAINHEKRIKGWLRRKKIALIEGTNPAWKDLSDGWHKNGDASLRSA
jgi:putative endonuclease